MLDAIRAEALKLHRHRATWTMVWIYPIGVTLLMIGLLLYGALATPHAAAAGAEPDTAAGWIADTAKFWRLPVSGGGRLLVAGFAAVVFAGEYGWNTWKLIIPARARWQLIAAKWVVALAFVVGALILADLIGLLGNWLTSLQRDPIPDGVTFAALADAHLRALGHALIPIVYTIAFAGMFAILTQSILATIVLSIALVVLEGLLPVLSILMYNYLPGLTRALVEFLPFYHMANMSGFARGGGLVLPLGAPPLAMTWETSLAAIAAWIAAAVAVTHIRFQRQDLN